MPLPGTSRLAAGQPHPGCHYLRDALLPAHRPYGDPVVKERAAGQASFTSFKGFQMQKSTDQAKTQSNRFQIVKLEDRIAPAILLVNPGGNVVQGDAQGQALENQNPAGHAPPGQNP